MQSKFIFRFFLFFFTMSALLIGYSAMASTAAAVHLAEVDEKFAPYEPRFGRSRPVIAVIGENSNTEMTDYVIPYSLLKQSGKADVFALAISPGTIKMFPTSLQMVPDSTAAEFDVRFPGGADYVIIPAVPNFDNAHLLAWIKSQHAKGATLVSICDGAFALANTGLLKGRRATAHWRTTQLRSEKYPDTRWLSNTRYVVDGRFASSAGISASIPISLALVEAISGRAAALELGAKYGVQEWDTRHNSDRFVSTFGPNLMPYAFTKYINPFFFRKEAVGIPLVTGMDDITLALMMDAYWRTGRSRTYAVGPDKSPVVTSNGLTFVPDLATTGDKKLDHVLTLSSDRLAAGVFAQVLIGMAKIYGRETAAGVAYAFEYPWNEPN